MIRIKIKDLARELGVTSRTVIDRCREAGLPVQNSVSKLDPHQAHVVRGLFTGEHDAGVLGKAPETDPAPRQSM